LNKDGLQKMARSHQDLTHVSRLHPTEADNEEGLRLARLAQQERLKEASKEAKEQEKLKPKKKPQKLRPNSTRPSSSAKGSEPVHLTVYLRVCVCA
jgi:CRISPR/Cas system-associated protein Cas7 (RAMP superfamily)